MGISCPSEPNEANEATRYRDGPDESPRARWARLAGVIRWLWLATVVGATGLYFVTPAPRQDVVYMAIGVLSSALIVAGVLFFRPSRPSAWYLIAAGHTVVVLADIVYYAYEPMLGSFPPYPSFIDAIYLASYPVTATGLLLLARSRSPGRDRAALIDGLIIVTAGALLTWVFLIAPYATDDALSLSEKLVSIAYPLMDLLILGVAARLVVVGGARGLSYVLVVSSFVITLAADAAFGVMSLAGTYRAGSLIDIGWLAAHGLLGAAAIHPSMRSLSEVTSTTHNKLTKGRMVALALASLTAPVILGVQAALEEPIQAPVLVGSCVVLSLLVLLRTWGLVREGETKADHFEKQGHELASSLDQRDALEQQLKHLAFHDPLTGVANRALFDDRLQHAVARSNRSRETLAILFLDLDGFKSVNDTLGHAAGDTVLMEVARRLQRCLRATDTLSRFGGDEFAVLIEGEGAEDTIATRSRLIAVLDEPFVVGLESVRICASIGIAVSGSEGIDAVELLASADSAMYDAKGQKTRA